MRRGFIGSNLGLLAAMTAAAAFSIPARNRVVVHDEPAKAAKTETEQSPQRKRLLQRQARKQTRRHGK